MKDTNAPEVCEENNSKHFNKVLTVDLKGIVLIYKEQDRYVYLHIGF